MPENSLTSVHKLFNSPVQIAAAPTPSRLKSRSRSLGMADELEIFLSDLAPEAQTRVLRFLRIKGTEELNLDMFPKFVLPKPERNKH